jgi:hypothetical protein
LLTPKRCCGTLVALRRIVTVPSANSNETPAHGLHAALSHSLEAGSTITAQFWKNESALRERLQAQGEFWADAVARLKREGNHMEAAVICRSQLPLPAAYQQLLICLRALHRRTFDHRALLHQLYLHAIEYDVLNRVPYVEFSTPLGQRGLPGFNVATIVFDWLRTTPIAFSYARVGHLYVRPLLKTDRRRLVAEFGEPDEHKDPFELARPLWERGVQELVRRTEQMDQESQAEWRRLLSQSQSQAQF